MSKKHQRNTTRSGSGRKSKASGASPEFFQNIKLQSWLIFGFAFLLYANTLGHGFVLDDGIVITENVFTKDGVKGIGGILAHDTFYGFFQQEGLENLVAGGRYRPMSLVLFAIIYQLVGANPFLFHLVTVLLFAFTCLVLYRVLLSLLNARYSEIATKAAWLGTMLFAAHPVHTEVVANIKGCDELLALLGSLGALYYALKAWDSGERKWALWSGIAFLIACLSKENAVTYAVLIPLAIWFFRDKEEDKATTSVWRNSMPIFAATVAFLLIRGVVLPWSSSFGNTASAELLNNPFLKYEGGQWVDFSFSEKFATIFYTLWEYVRLLFVPHPLTHDYYPRHIDMMSFGNPMVLLSLAMYGFLAVWAILGLKKRDPIAYAILLYLLPLGIVSNILFPVGTNMSERFIFMPSIGFSLAAGIFLSRNWDKNKSLVTGIFGIAMLLFSLKTISRNANWKSNDSLFMTDVEVSKHSAKLQNACAQLLLDQAREEKDLNKKRQLCQDAVKRTNISLEYYPEFKASIVVRAGAELEMEQFEEAIKDYRKALSLAPDDKQRKVMLALALREYGKYYGQKRNDLANAFKNLNESWDLNPEDPETARLLGVANFVQGKQDEAIAWYQKAEKAAPNDAASLWELGIAYANLGMQEVAQALHAKAMALDPDIAQKAAAGSLGN